MARTCTVCVHPDQPAIDKALVGPESLRYIAECFDISSAALHRHRREHLPEVLAQAKHQRQETHAVAVGDEVRVQDANALSVMDELTRCFHRVNLLFDACDRWLRDADDPTRYDLSPRADDVQVTYFAEGRGGKEVRKKAPLSRLLAKLEDAGIDVDRGEVKVADTRELVLKTAGQLQGQIQLLAKLLGELEDRPQVTITASPEWLQVRGLILTALAPYPEARSAVAANLAKLEVTDD